MSHEVKKEETTSEVNQRISVENILEKVPVDELLGSVTTYPEGNDKNQSLRSSARVFKKIKLDANLNAPSASNGLDKSAPEKKEEPKPETPSRSEQRKQPPTWSAEDRAIFFEALNEYGKDFESIHNYIVQKLKKKGVCENILITKEHVRHLYYKTWHKISKFLKFSEGTKKTAQELYGLINYGELRKKLVFTQKISHKLKVLIYHGCVTIRTKGKTVKVKTPMCAALRHLNKLDDKDDDLKLPPRIVVELRPRDMSSFLKVQSFASNPRVRTVLPLQKKLNTLIACISKKWRTAEFDYLKNIYPSEEMTNGEMDEEDVKLESCFDTSQLTFTPPRGTKINLPVINLCDYFERDSLCLKAYEERMGIESSKNAGLFIERKENKKQSTKARAENDLPKSPVKSEVQILDKITSNPTETEISMNVSASTSNFSSKPEVSILKNSYESNVNTEIIKNEPIEVLNNLIASFGAENEKNDKIDKTNTERDLDTSTQTVSKSTKIKKEIECLDMSFGQGVSKADEIVDNKHKSLSAEEQLNKLEEIQSGWTAENCDTITIGELYLMFGSSSKLILEYHWSEKIDKNLMEDSSSAVDEEIGSKPVRMENLKETFGFSDALRKLASLIKFQQKKVVPRCPCGHVCSPKNSGHRRSQSKSVLELEDKTSVEESPLETDITHSGTGYDELKQKNTQIDEFLRPQPPPHLMAQLDSIQKLKPKYTVRKGRRIRTKPLLVERELPLTSIGSSGHQIVRMNIISPNTSNNQFLSNAEDHCEVDTQTMECEMEIFMDKTLYIKENGTQISDNVSGSTSRSLISELNVPMEIGDTMSDGNRTTDSLSVFLQDSSRSISPSGLLKENANTWISSEVGDFSLSSFLGHLESPMKSQDDVSHDVDAQVRSLLTENSFDYTAKFADLANKVTSDSAN